MTALLQQTDFWDSFWPGLWSNGLATIIGVLVGVPIALKIDRGLRAKRQQEAQIEKTARLVRLLDALERALAGNIKVVEELIGAAERGQVPLLISFNSAGMPFVPMLWHYSTIQDSK